MPSTPSPDNVQPPSEPLHLLIFDFDGTLADTLPIVVKAFQSSIAKITGRHLSEPEITKHFGITEEGIMRRLVPDAWEPCLRVYLQDYEAGHEGVAPFAGIVPLLENLRSANMKLAVATGKGALSTEISFRKLKLTGYFSEIETGSPERDIKASRIRKLLSIHSVLPERAAYIGDSPTDIVAAREAQVLPIAAAWASTSNPETLAAANPERLFTSVEKFAQWLALTK